MQEIKLGDQVKCKHTAFEGRVIARTQWINNCDRLTVQPTTLDKDGKIRESHTFDVMDLELLKAQEPELAPVKHGGPAPEPQRNIDPV